MVLEDVGMRPISKNQMADFWIKHYSRTNHCSLCGNKGTIDTRGKVFTAAGVECGDKVWCICPNGQHIMRAVGNDYPLEAKP